MIGLDAIGGGREDTPFAIDQRGADRHITAGGCRLGLGQGQLHR
jgi:hypothetical protein